MTRFLAFALIAVLAVAPASASVIASLNLAATNVDDGIAPLADVYQLALTNMGDVAVTSLGLDFTPADIGVTEFFVDGFTASDLFPAQLTAADGTLPEFRGAPITHTFVVKPEGVNPLFVTDGQVNDGTAFIFNYTSGDGLVGPDETVGVAHLSVPAGEVPSVPSALGALGSFVRDGELLPIAGIPEPATALLAGLAAVGFVARRR